MGICFSDVSCGGVVKIRGVKITLLKTHVDSSSPVVGARKHQNFYKKHHCKPYNLLEGHSLIKAEINCGSSDL